MGETKRMTDAKFARFVRLAADPEVLFAGPVAKEVAAELDRSRAEESRLSAEVAARDLTILCLRSDVDALHRTCIEEQERSAALRAEVETLKTGAEAARTELREWREHYATERTGLLAQVEEANYSLDCNAHEAGGWPKCEKCSRCLRAQVEELAGGLNELWRELCVGCRRDAPPWPNRRGYEPRLDPAQHDAKCKTPKARAALAKVRGGGK
jgi:hypothetical protein